MPARHASGVVVFALPRGLRKHGREHRVTEDERFMARALELAARPPFTSPNPRVGAVVARDGVVISESKHEGSGTPHAEALALENVDATGATLYVTLEPCAHQGKMPPCAPAIVQAGITRVVAAIEDPDDRVAGRGLETLRSAGVEVVVGVGDVEARAQNRAYLHHRRTKWPLVTLKLAMSLDGKIAAPDGSSKWITGETTRRRVHSRRLEADAVLIGAGTVVTDDPSLTVRDVAAPRQPVRVICDARGTVLPTSKVFGDGDVIVMTTDAAEHSLKTRWKEAGAEVVELPASPDGGVDLSALLADLGARGWIEVYCEGGARLATSLLFEDLVDVLELNYGPILVGGPGVGLGDLGVATIGAAPRWRPLDLSRMNGDVVVVMERDR